MRTRVFCPRCRAEWGTADSGLQPYDYTIFMQGPKTYCDIHAFPNQIDAFVRQAQIDPYLGMAILKIEDQLVDLQDAEGRRARNPNHSGGRAPSTANLVTRLFDEAQDLDAFVVIATALVGQCDPSRGSGE